MVSPNIGALGSQSKFWRARASCRPTAAATIRLTVYRDVEGVYAFIGAVIAPRRHGATEIALKNFETQTLVPSPTRLADRVKSRDEERSNLVVVAPLQFFGLTVSFRAPERCCFGGGRDLVAACSIYCFRGR
jgi:hypothetical protein